MLGHRRRSPRRRRGTAIYRCKIPAMTSHVFIVTTRLAFSWYFYLNLRHVHVDKKSRSTPVKSHVLGESAAVVQPLYQENSPWLPKKGPARWCYRVSVWPRRPKKLAPGYQRVAPGGRSPVGGGAPAPLYARSCSFCCFRQAAGTAPPVRARPCPRVRTSGGFRPTVRRRRHLQPCNPELIAIDKDA
jgi:hypothetical protein